MQVISLLSKQSTALRYLYCYQCGLQFKETLPVTMQPEQVSCPGCEMEGFVLGQTRK